ncbi:MAG: hypothetical protein WC749_01920 [Dehalococcoidia bacterium]
MIKLLPWPGSLENRNKIQEIKNMRSVMNYGLKESKDIIDALWTGRSVEIDANSHQQTALETLGFLTDHGTVDQGFHDLLTCVVRSRQYRLAHALLLAWFGEERRQKS